MSCISPITLQQPTGSVTVPCGRCYGCLKRKRSGWLLRLENEQRVSTRSFFVTLTYNNENLPTYKNAVCFDKSHLQKYFKRLRKHGKFRYFAVSEYGGKYGRPHYHVLFFSMNVPVKEIIKQWHYGHVHLGDITPASINYCAAYVITKEQQDFDIDDPRRPFSLMSRRPGLGLNYVDRMKKYHQKGKKPYGVRQFGEKVPLPRYYSEKIFSKVERQVIAKTFKTEFETNDIDTVLNKKEWHEKNPGLTSEDYYEYRTQVIASREKKLYKSLKQIRDGKDF